MHKNKKLKLNKSTIKHMLNFFGFKGAGVRSIVAVLILGISLGVAYEEMVGVGTWHNFHADTDKINLCFTPPSGCGDLIAREVARAQHSIYVKAYVLTSKPIIYQLKSAPDRGVEVNVILDGGNLSNNQNIH
jgi:phospholipase D